MSRGTRDLAWLYLFGLLAVWAGFRLIGTQWWPITVLLFAPRWVYGIPLAALLPLTLLTRPRILPLYGLHVAVWLIPIMGWQVSGWPLADGGKADSGGAESGDDVTRLRLISCNVGGGDLDVDALVRLAESSGCELMLLQECPPRTSQQLASQLDWHVASVHNLAILSIHSLSPAEVLARQGPAAYQAVVAITCDVAFEEAEQRLSVINVHLPTLRPGLEQLLKRGLDAGPQVDAARDYHAAFSARAQEALQRLPRPQLIAGDFNMPVEGTSYRQHWGHLSNAFSQRGSGFGYTKHTRWHGIRIDHVLSDQAWRPLSARIGPGLGGDHRPLIVELERTGKENHAGGLGHAGERGHAGELRR